MMQAAINRLLTYGLNISRYQKRLTLAVFDLLLLNFALWLAMTIRFGYFYSPPTWKIFLLLAVVPLIAVAAYFRAGVYRHITRHFGSHGARLIAVCTSLSALGLGLGAFILEADGIPRSVLFLYPLFGTLLVWGNRRIIRWLIIGPAGIKLPPVADAPVIANVIIYGVGPAGQALLEAVRRSRALDVIGFVDPDPTLWRQYIDSVRVYPPESLANLVRARDVRQVLLATQNASRKDRLEVLRRLENCPVEVRALPPLEDIASGRVSVTDLRRVEAIDLLARQPIPPDPALMARSVEGKCVLVTGAGGSIGSELVRQVLRYGPRRLVILDASETNLYEIGMEVADLLRSERWPSDRATPELVSVLGSVSSDHLVRKCLLAHQVQTVYHAAAFKHVPIVEHNPAEGLLNNTLATQTLARAAESCGVERFVLISTDKAVRPSSVMGASKRLAEMILQALAKSKAPRTVFAIVRFGNVLDSSGSVVRLFRRQIEAGGPVTVTHPDIVRYFISIPEAAGLVMQAGAMATGGETFALDMGEPIKIVDIARMMIQLSGLHPRDPEHPDGDIEVSFTGLRPGEKLSEELYLSEHTLPTAHPRIVRVDEPFLSQEDLALVIDALQNAIAQDDQRAIRQVLSRYVEGYTGGETAQQTALPARNA